MSDVGWLQQVSTLILQIVEKGGMMALIAFIAYLLFKLSQILLIGGVIWYTIKAIFKGIAPILDRLKEVKQTKITLLSSEISKEILEILATLKSTNTQSSQVGVHQQNIKEFGDIGSPMGSDLKQL